MTGISNNNLRQVIVKGNYRSDKTWLSDKRISQGRNSPLPNRNFGKGGPPGGVRSRQFLLGECSWYRVCVSILLNYINVTHEEIINTLSTKFCKLIVNCSVKQKHFRKTIIILYLKNSKFLHKRKSYIPSAKC